MERNDNFDSANVGQGGAGSSGGAYGSGGSLGGAGSTSGAGTGSYGSTGGSTGGSLGGSTGAGASGTGFGSTGADYAGEASSKLADAKDAAGEKLGQAKDVAGEKLGQAKEAAGKGLGALKEKASTLTATLADRLEAGAEKLRGRQGGASMAYAGGSAVAADDRMGQLNNQLAGGLQGAADFLREGDLKASIETQVKEHPGRTLLIALGVGYVLGKAFRR